MSDLQAIADRVEIEALRGEFTDAGMMRDYERCASVFALDAAWRMPHIDVEFVGRPEIRYLDTTPLTGSAPSSWSDQA